MAVLSFAPIPAPAVTGFAVQSGIKSAALKWDAVPGVTFEVWSGSLDDVTQATKLTETEGNSYFVTGINTNTFFWVRSVNEFGTLGAFTESEEYTVTLVTTADVAQVAAPTNNALSIGSSSGAPTATNYGEWYASSAASFTPTDDSVVQASIYQASTISNVSVSFGNGVKVWARTRLRDTTTGADVPAGTKKWLLYDNNGSGISAFGNLSNLLNMHETYVTGFRGLLVPGHSYTLYAEVMKQQTGGGTCDLKVNSGGAEISGAAFS